MGIPSYRASSSPKWLSEPAESRVSSSGKTYPPKIEQIVKDISELTLLETSQLNELLKVLIQHIDVRNMIVSFVYHEIIISYEILV